MGLKNLGQMFKARDSGTGSAILRELAGAYRSNVSRIRTNYTTAAKDAYAENAIAFRCVEEISNACCQIGLVVKKMAKDGTSEPIPHHVFQEMIDKPNDQYSRTDLIDRYIVFRHLAGEAPFQVMKNSFRTKIYIYRPDRIEYTATGGEYEQYTNIYYQYGGNTYIPPEEFMLIKKYNPDDYLDGMGRGLPMSRPAWKLIDQYQASKDWNISLMEHGARPSGIVSLEDDINDEDYERTKKNLRQAHQGHDNVGKLLLLTGGTKYQETSHNPKDLDFVEGTKQIIIEIHSALKVDPLITGFPAASSYNNKKEAMQNLYRSAAIPEMQTLAEHLTRHGRLMGILKDNEFVDLDLSKVEALKESSDELHKRANESDYLTINQKLEMVGKENIGPSGDIIVENGVIIDITKKQTYIPMNMVPVGTEPTKPNKDDVNKKDFFY